MISSSPEVILLCAMASRVFRSPCPRVWTSRWTRRFSGSATPAQVPLMLPQSCIHVYRAFVVHTARFIGLRRKCTSSSDRVLCELYPCFRRGGQHGSPSHRRSGHHVQGRRGAGHPASRRAEGILARLRGQLCSILATAAAVEKRGHRTNGFWKPE